MNRRKFKVILPIYISCMFLAAMVTFVFGFLAGRQFLVRSNGGEALVAQAINSGVRGHHALLNNVTLKTDRGTSQIDHVLVSSTGIFVIETKHYSGWIFGRPDDEYWTQTIFKTKFRFQNPLRQNYGHVKALQALFKLPQSDFIPLVVFTGDAEFKTDLGPMVLKLPQLLEVLSADRPVVFDEKKMTYIVGRIEMKRLRRSIETDENHQDYVRRRIQERAVARA
jgi:restriction system protein